MKQKMFHKEILHSVANSRRQEFHSQYTHSNGPVFQWAELTSPPPHVSLKVCAFLSLLFYY